MIQRSGNFAPSPQGWRSVQLEESGRRGAPQGASVVVQTALLVASAVVQTARSAALPFAEAPAAKRLSSV